MVDVKILKKKVKNKMKTHLFPPLVQIQNSKVNQNWKKIK